MRSIVGIDDGVNLYAYVGNDPLNKTDPTGQFSAVGIAIPIIIVGAVIVAGCEATGSCQQLGQLAGDVLEGIRNIPLPSHTIGGLLTTIPIAPALPTAMESKEFYRGAKPGDAPSFAPKEGEYKVDSETGFVKPTHGVSVFDNPDSVAGKGFVPHEIDRDTVPSSLQIKQRGADPSHHEIMPAPDAKLRPNEFKKPWSASNANGNERFAVRTAAPA